MHAPCLPGPVQLALVDGIPSSGRRPLSWQQSGSNPSGMVGEGWEMRFLCQGCDARATIAVSTSPSSADMPPSPRRWPVSVTDGHESEDLQSTGLRATVVVSGARPAGSVAAVSAATIAGWCGGSCHQQRQAHVLVRQVDGCRADTLWVAAKSTPSSFAQPPAALQSVSGGQNRAVPTQAPSLLDTRQKERRRSPLGVAGGRS
jgi:hypothetical protein